MDLAREAVHDIDGVWVIHDKAGECNKYEDERRRKEAVQPREMKVQQAGKERERDLRHTL